jgi:4-amino-4-deoxy-L-arabinose transferase-like glycosyltransferase
VLATIGIRVVGIDRPLVGNFATKSVVYAMAARNWALGRAPVWCPMLDLSAGDERAWHLMEWPASAYLVSRLWRIFGGSIDVWGRGLAIACSAASVIFIYLLGRRWFGETAGRTASLVMAFAPVSWIYGQTFLLEPSITALSLAAVYGFDTWLAAGSRRWLAVAAVCFALAVATKIYLLLLAVPLVARWWMAGGPRRTAGPTLAAALVFALALSPTAAWYLYVARIAADSGPAVDFHPLSRAGVHSLPSPLLADPSFYTRLARDFATVALTPIGLLAAAVGVCDRRSRSLWLWLAMAGLLVVLLPLKFFHANYYYLVLLPPLALAAGIGWQRLIEQGWVGRRAAIAGAALSLAVAARLSIAPAFITPDEDRTVTKAAAAFHEVAAAEEPVATLHGATIDLLYYCDRRGWALNADDPQLSERLAEARSRGAKHLVVAAVADAQRRSPWFKSHAAAWPIVRSGDDWCVYRIE